MCLIGEPAALTRHIDVFWFVIPPQTRLLEAAQSVRPTRLTAEELARNQMGQIQVRGTATAM